MSSEFEYRWSDRNTIDNGPRSAINRKNNLQMLMVLWQIIFCGMIRSGKVFFPITEDENSYLELVIFFVECINDGLFRCAELNFLCSSNKTTKCKLKLACKSFCAFVHNLTKYSHFVRETMVQMQDNSATL